jgi:hypothetical protein
MLAFTTNDVTTGASPAALNRERQFVGTALPNRN